jgi:hypothetical protein
MSQRELARLWRKLKSQYRVRTEANASAKSIDFWLRENCVFWLKIFPITLAVENDCLPMADSGGIQCDGKHSHLESVIVVDYERAGAVPTGSL